MALFREGRSEQEEQRPLRRTDLLWWMPALPLLLLFTVPVAALVLRTSPANLARGLATPEAHQAIWLSLRTSLAATVFTALAGTPLAYLLARRTFRIGRLIDAAVDLPMVLPPAVAGVALLVTFGRGGLLGGSLEVLGLQIAFTEVAVVLAQMFVAGPLYVRAAAIGFKRIDRDLEDAAVLDGAGPWQMFRHITLPLARTALANGAILTWARALGEFGATIIFAGNYPGRTQTMPLAIYLGFELDLSVALSLSVVLVAFSFLVLAIARSVVTS